MTNKPTFLTLRVTNNTTEYINTNHVLKATYTKTYDSEALIVTLITGAMLTYVVGSNLADKAILQQWLDFLERGK